MQNICSFCHQRPKSTIYAVYKFIVYGRDNVYVIGLKTLLEGLGKWAMEQMYHLSASEILLLRPDITLKYLKEIKPLDEIKGFSFQENKICQSCYLNYAEAIPLR